MTFFNEFQICSFNCGSTRKTYIQALRNWDRAYSNIDKHIIPVCDKLDIIHKALQIFSKAWVYVGPLYESYIIVAEDHITFAQKM